MISIVDLKTGAVSARASDTRTLDLPVDLDLATAVAALDGRSHVLYRSTRGKEVSCLVHPRPLSWRVFGEECLVADEGAVAGNYTLCAVEPIGDA
jgi:hypothetical protein